MSYEDIQSKQVYLRQNILQKGYDGQGFMHYCKQKCGLIDLQNWTFNFLKNIVSAYIKQVQKNTQHKIQQIQNKQEEDWSDFTQITKTQSIQNKQEQKQKQIQFTQADWQIFLGGQVKKAGQKPSESMSPPSNVKKNIYKTEQQKNQQENKNKQQKEDKQKNQNVQKNQNSQRNQNQQKVPEIKLKSQEFCVEKKKIQQVRTIKMKTLRSKQQNPLPSINDITILKTQQKTRNFLQGDYTLYTIKFTPCEHIIHRKFNDFRKLRVILQKLYPYIRLPYLQPQGWLVNSSQARDQQTLTKYKYMVVQFLKYITMRNQTLKKSKIVRIFTGMIEGTPNDFKKYQNIQRPKKINQLCVPEGQIKFSHYQSLSPIDKYMTNTQLLMADIDGHYQKLRKTMQTLYYNFQQVSKSVTDVGFIFQSLQNTISKFNFQNDQNKDLKVYQGLKEVCFKMKESLTNHYTIFKTKIQNLFRFEKENMITLKQINQVRSRLYTEYVRQGCKTKQIKQTKDNPQQLQVQSNVSIQQPCKNNKNTLITQNMMWSYYTLKNVNQYWKQLRYKINEQLTLIAYDQLDSQNDNLNFWNTVIKKCVI